VSEWDKKSDSDSQCCQKSDSDSTQIPPTPYDSDSATLIVAELESMRQAENMYLLQRYIDIVVMDVERIFSRGPKVVIFHFFSLETKKTTLFC